MRLRSDLVTRWFKTYGGRGDDLAKDIENLKGAMGSDCGLGTFAGFGAVDPAIVYAKLGALA